MDNSDREYSTSCESLNYNGVLTLSSKVVAFKSIAAYRSGLRINPLVSAQESENGLFDNLRKCSFMILSEIPFHLYL
jgi:hypothetical protein